MKKVLIVDDEVKNLKAAERLSRNSGISVETCLNPFTHQIMKPHDCDAQDAPCHLDAIMSDYRLDGCNGLDFLKQFQNSNCLHKAKIRLSLASSAMPVEVEQEARSLGIHIMTKPTTQQELWLILGMLA